MFSVVIPLYNKEISIQNTIQSVLEQTFQNFEIVIINDGSTDSSAEVVEGINDNRIRLVHQENQGVSAARNRGIKEAKYEWVAFLDGDDLWHKEHLTEYKSSIMMFPDINWLFSGFTIVNGKKRIDKTVNTDANAKLVNVFDSLLAGLVIHTSAVCMRRSLFDQYPGLYFRDGLNNSEDREVWYKLSCVDMSPVYIAKSLSCYYVGSHDSLTNQNVNDHFLSMRNRLKSFVYLTSSENEKKLLNILKSFNRKALFLKYKNGCFEISYKEHLDFFEYYFLRFTVVFPFYVRYLVMRVLCR